jgi:hypothetical protein
MEARQIDLIKAESEVDNDDTAQEEKRGASTLRTFGAVVRPLKS